MSEAYWQDMVRKYSAVKVRREGALDQSKRLPHISDKPDDNIWFETRNFGWIFSKFNPETKSRKMLVRY